MTTMCKRMERLKRVWLILGACILGLIILAPSAAVAHQGDGQTSWGRVGNHSGGVVTCTEEWVWVGTQAVPVPSITVRGPAVGGFYTQQGTPVTYRAIIQRWADPPYSQWYNYKTLPWQQWQNATYYRNAAWTASQTYRPGITPANSTSYYRIQYEVYWAENGQRVGFDRFNNNDPSNFTGQYSTGAWCRYDG